MMQAHRSPRTRPADFSGALYNGMLDVMHADANVREGGLLETARRVLGPIFVRHGVERLYGINLLHTHWKVEAGEIPSQSRRPFESGFELVTRPEAVAAEGVVPSSWAVDVQGSDYRILPFEFSTDEEVRSAARELDTTSAFFAEASEALIEHGLHQYFGICIFARERLSSNEDTTPVEVSSVKGRMSVIRAKSLGEQALQAFIQTSWTFSPDDSDKASPSPTPTPKPPPLPKCNIHGVCEMDDPPTGPPHHAHSHEHDPD